VNFKFVKLNCVLIVFSSFLCDQRVVFIERYSLKATEAIYLAHFSPNLKVLSLAKIYSIIISRKTYNNKAHKNE
jgi:hypothetical protein